MGGSRGACLPAHLSRVNGQQSPASNGGGIVIGSGADGTFLGRSELEQPRWGASDEHTHSC